MENFIFRAMQAMRCMRIGTQVCTVNQFGNLSFYLSICLSVSLSVCLSVCLSIYLQTHSNHLIMKHKNTCSRSILNEADFQPFPNCFKDRDWIDLQHILHSFLSLISHRFSMYGVSLLFCTKPLNCGYLSLFLKFQRISHVLIINPTTFTDF